jgi:hypothetical protein
MEKRVIAKNVYIGKNMKETFLKNEIWSLTIAGAFQRAYVYSSFATDQTKDKFKFALFNFIDTKSKEYFSEVSEKVHLNNIQSVSAFSEGYGDILKDGKLNFGVSQKLLNLYLKYLWCLNILQIPPPHFPVDRIIQGELKWKDTSSWTKMDNDTEYLKIIEYAKQVAAEKGFESIADLELNLFSQRKRNGQTI